MIAAHILCEIENILGIEHATFRPATYLERISAVASRLGCASTDNPDDLYDEIMMQLALNFKDLPQLEKNAPNLAKLLTITYGLDANHSTDWEQNYIE